MRRTSKMAERWSDRYRRPTPNLHQQLLRSHFSVALVGIIILLVAVFSTYQLRNQVMVLSQESAPLAQSSLRVLAGIQRSMSNLRAWVSFGDPHFLQNWYHAWDLEIRPAVALLQHYRNRYGGSEIAERLTNLQALLDQLHSTQQRIQETVMPDNVLGADADSTALRRRAALEADPLADRVIALTSDLVSAAEMRFQRDAQAAHVASVVTFIVLISTALTMLGIAYLISRQRARALTRPIAALVEATQRLGEGAASADLPIRRNDELGTLTRNFNLMRTAIERGQAELREANASLEMRVAERTTELGMTNQSLRDEIEYHNRTESALRESEARIRAMTRAIPDLVFVVDDEGRYREILAAGRDSDALRATQSKGSTFPLLPNHLGRRAADQELRGHGFLGMVPLRGQLLTDVHPPEIAQFFNDIIQRSLETQKIQVAEYEVSTGSGLRWFESRTAPLDIPLRNRQATLVNRAQLALFNDAPAPAAKQRAAIVVARDITKRKQAETQLRQAQKMQAVGQLTGGIAHDFNNLLAVIMGNLELLHEQLAQQPQLEELAEQALHAVDRGAALTRRLLVFSRYQPLQAQPTDLNQLITGMIELIRRTLGASIDIQTVLAPDLAPTRIDPDQFETALLNLVINARDAMPQAGQLMLETANVILDDDYAATHQDVKPGAYVVLTVSDSGVGMPPEVLERVFEPFFTTKEVSKGSGLGLSMVYGVVKQSGGHISIYSEPGRGSTVYLYLPRAPLEGGANREQQIATHSAARGNGEIILVVEDDAAVRLFAVKVLHNLGYKTRQAKDAKSALEIISNAPDIDLMFTDIVLPGHMDGVALASEVRHRRPGLPVLFSSGYNEHMLTKQSELIAGLELLPKPYRKRELASKIHLLLQRTAAS